MTTSVRNRRLAVARLWMHDRLCIQGPECHSREDHARRTQHEFARRALVADEKSLGELAELVHAQGCQPYRTRGECRHSNPRAAAAKAARDLSRAIRAA